MSFLILATYRMNSMLSVVSNFLGLGRSTLMISFTVPGLAVNTKIRSERNTASEISCVTKSTVFVFSNQILWSHTFISSRVMASSDPKGSSIKSRGGSWMRARQKETLCCMPPESSRDTVSQTPPGLQDGLIPSPFPYIPAYQTLF